MRCVLSRTISALSSKSLAVSQVRDFEDMNGVDNENCVWHAQMCLDDFLMLDCEADVNCRCSGFPEPNDFAELSYNREYHTFG